jgi:predicted amidophosphoribosyltransferase
MLNNHEIWRKCNHCGSFYDLRKSNRCEECGSKSDHSAHVKVFPELLIQAPLCLSVSESQSIAYNKNKH